jgi:hypothetical protein
VKTLPKKGMKIMNSEGEYLKDEGVKCPPAYLKMLY